jgi:hypothetical protein
MKSRLFQSLFLLALLSMAALGLSGCATSESEYDNTSARPWDAPKGWENSAYGTLGEGR